MAASPPQLPSGTWGGDHVALTVTAAGATAEFDCAHGSIDESPLLQSDGQFSLKGTYIREHGGPVYDGEPEDRHPAVYSGRLRGSSVTLSVQLVDDGTLVGPFSASRGQQPRVFKCL
jgi:hypothetical protein